MTVSRRRLVQIVAFATASGPAAKAADPAIPLDVLRNVSRFDGTNLNDERLQVLKPVLEHRAPQLRALREFEIDDTVEPAHGCF